MLIQEDCGGIEGADLHGAAQDGLYHTCSGDSYWVRQYLKWCDYERVGTDQDVRPLAIVVKGALAAEATSHARRLKIGIGEWPNDKCR